MAFRLLFREVKRPKYYNEQTIGTLNAHASLAWVVLMFVWVLGRPIFTVSEYPRFLFLVKWLLSNCNECKQYNYMFNQKQSIMRKIFLFTLVLMCSVSCSTTYQFCQIGKLESDNVILSDKGSYDYTHSDLTISYDFWSEGGEVSFAIINKSDKDIYLLTNRSFFVKNGKAYDYFKNRVLTSTSTNAPSTVIYNYVSQTANQHIVQTHELSRICIPAKSYKHFSEFSTHTTPYRQCGFARDSREKDGDKLTFPNSSTSPIRIENRLVFDIAGEIVPIVNTFYVVELINILYSEGYMYISDYSKDCNGKPTSWYPDVKFCKHLSPNCFYISYNCTPGVDNDRINTQK